MILGEPFDNVAAALNISDALNEKYFAPVDLIIIIECLYAVPQKPAQPNPDALAGSVG
ncbi:hypothetical protein [Frigoriglobus tundricola]|uniref:Uncharacterized protein n=1 Tax=Frigoriglobus tundricola TaxID=2774151 RepID=A0A6M5Z2M8_9BACT|nr:hypothetical protein [Frigoriglobus tundricola]QJX00326.1 hypothetical protein FTUN_7952 [Frigoriglobus tundricola]